MSCLTDDLLTISFSSLTSFLLNIIYIKVGKFEKEQMNGKNEMQMAEELRKDHSLSCPSWDFITYKLKYIFSSLFGIIIFFSLLIDWPSWLFTWLYLFIVPPALSFAVSEEELWKRSSPRNKSIVGNYTSIDYNYEQINTQLAGMKDCNYHGEAHAH